MAQSVPHASRMLCASRTRLDSCSDFQTTVQAANDKYLKFLEPRGWRGLAKTLSTNGASYWHHKHFSWLIVRYIDAAFVKGGEHVPHFEYLRYTKSYASTSVCFRFMNRRIFDVVRHGNITTFTVVFPTRNKRNTYGTLRSTNLHRFEVRHYCKNTHCFLERPSRHKLVIVSSNEFQCFIHARVMAHFLMKLINITFSAPRHPSFSLKTNINNSM